MSDDDVIPVGKLRRPGRPGAAISYDPGHGIRVEDEDVPPAPAEAAAWLRRHAGWVRIRKAIPKGHPPLEDFIRAVRRK